MKKKNRIVPSPSPEQSPRRFVFDFDLLFKPSKRSISLRSAEKALTVRIPPSISSAAALDMFWSRASYSASLEITLRRKIQLDDECLVDMCVISIYLWCDVVGEHNER